MFYENTVEEKAYQALLDEKLETLSEPAYSILDEAETAAYSCYLIRNHCYQLEEHEEAIEKVRLAATRITQRDREILAEIVRASFLTALSIDPGDKRPAGHKVDRGHHHYYYKNLSGLIDKALTAG